MLSLVLTILSILLLSAAALISISYSPAGEYVTQATLNKLRTGLTGLQTGYNNYVAATGSTPTTANWGSVLTPQYVFLPATPGGNLQWSYASGATYGSTTGNYFCLSGTWTEAQYRGALSAANWFSPQAYFISSGCGATSNATTPSSWPATAAVTFWVAVS